MEAPALKTKITMVKKNVMERPNSRLEVTKRVTELKKKQLKSPNLSIRKITLKK